MQEVSHGSERLDTVTECGHPNTGLLFLINWNVLQDGQHTVEGRRRFFRKLAS